MINDKIHALLPCYLFAKTEENKVKCRWDLRFSGHLAGTCLSSGIYITPCSLVDTYRHFRGSYCLQHWNNTVSPSEVSVMIYQTKCSNMPSSKRTHIAKGFESKCLSLSRFKSMLFLFRWKLKLILILKTEQPNPSTERSAK